MLLRLSVTERCNFRCRYCLPPGTIISARRHDLPSLAELADAVEWLQVHRNVRRVKITGGEPLLRNGLPTLVETLFSTPGIEEISLTTNGSRLAALARPLKQAGLKRVNVSLDTLDPERFRDLTQGRLKDTLDGIEAALAVGLLPLKLNAVLRRSSWREDVPALLDFAAERGLELRFIELMHAGPAAEWASREYVAASIVQEWLRETCGLTREAKLPATPARLTSLSWKGRTLRVGWITPQSHPFCDGCNRLRLDSLGRLRRCLMDPLSLPLISILKDEPESASSRVNAYLNAKRPPLAMSTVSPMAVVGG